MPSKAELNSAYNNSSYIRDLMDNSQNFVEARNMPGMSVDQAKASARRRAGKVSKASSTIESKPIGVDGYTGDAKEAPTLKQPNTAGKTMEALYEGALAKESRAQTAAAAGEFIVEVLNAQAEYNSAIGQAHQNIWAARNQQQDTLFLGRQAQTQAELEGYKAGQDATLAMAAQGQDVQNSSVENIQGSFEAMGIQAGMMEYNNSVREALGYQIEEINVNAQLKAAKAARNAAIIGSGLKAGAKAYGAMA